MTGTALAQINPDRWAMIQRMAGAFCKSEMVPDAMRDNVANCTVALLLAEQMGENPLMVMQNIFFVHGRAGWITQYMVARTNMSGKFLGPLRWRSGGTDANPSETCFAKLMEFPTEDAVEVEIDLKTAIDSDWTTFVDRKDGNKKKTHARWATLGMQRQMLRWRSAAWLIRLYAPEVMFGMPTSDELEDTLKDVTPPRPTIDDFKPGAARKQPETMIEDTAASADTPLSGHKSEATIGIDDMKSDLHNSQLSAAGKAGGSPVEGVESSHLDTEKSEASADTPPSGAGAAIVPPAIPASSQELSDGASGRGERAADSVTLAPVQSSDGSAATDAPRGSDNDPPTAGGEAAAKKILDITAQSREAVPDAPRGNTAPAAEPPHERLAIELAEDALSAAGIASVLGRHLTEAASKGLKHFDNFWIHSLTLEERAIAAPMCGHYREIAMKATP